MNSVSDTVVKASGASLARELQIDFAILLLLVVRHPFGHFQFFRRGEILGRLT
jgi:hypothetical protein